MADIVPPEVRSRMMSGIRGRDTKPELVLRKGLHRMGFRYRTDVRELPGRPDIVFPRYRAVLFAHGCFWHGHDCSLFRMPGTRAEFWASKIESNRQRDAVALSALGSAGWRVGTVWECAMRGPDRMAIADVLDRCALWIRSSADVLDLRGEI